MTTANARRYRDAWSRTRSFRSRPSRTRWSRRGSTFSQALDGGFGNVIVDIEPTVERTSTTAHAVFTWLQATQIGLDAFVDNTELVGFATELKTGKPLAGVDLSIYPNGKGVSGAQR